MRDGQPHIKDKRVIILQNTAFHLTLSGRKILKNQVAKLMMKARKMSGRLMTKARQLLDRLKKMLDLMVDQLMIKERGMLNKPVVKPMLTDSKLMIKARELIKLLKDLLNSWASKPMIKAGRILGKLSSGVNKLREEQQTTARLPMIKVEKT